MKIFIGSAGESKETVDNIKLILEQIGEEATAWFDIETFVPSSFTLENLEHLAENFDAAIFVYSEDDSLSSREKDYKSVRDNVILEAGLFSGKMGHKKVLICTKGEPKIPTDQWGLTTAEIIPGNIEHTKKKIQIWLNDIKDIHIKTSSVNILPRSENDIISPIEERWKYAKEITFVNFASTAFIAASKVVPNHVATNSLRDLYLDKIKNGCNFKFLITEPNTFADFDASFSKMNLMKQKGVDVSNIISMGLEGLEEDFIRLEKEKNDSCGTLEFSTTDIALPYGLILVINDEAHSDLDHIKVDLYSPHLSNDNERRSFIIYRNNENFLFFMNHVVKLWNNSKAESQTEPSNKPSMITHENIKKSLEMTYRQYFVGDLKNAQPLLKHIYDKKLEVGISLYKNFTTDIPHFHTYASEYLYVLKGEYKLCIKTADGFLYKHLKKGDFFFIPKLTPYASKALQNTQVLFIKSPSINDKVENDNYIFTNFLMDWENDSSKKEV